MSKHSIVPLVLIFAYEFRSFPVRYEEQTLSTSSLLCNLQKAEYSDPIKWLPSLLTKFYDPS